MNTKGILTLLLTIACSFSLFAQEKDRCHSTEKMMLAYGDYDAHMQEIDEGIKAFNKLQEPTDRQMFVEIPVHVVIVHPPGQSIGTGSNLSLAQIESQIEVLNEDFTASNDDYSDVPAGFSPGDPQIFFCLASTDENGNPTDGVTRYATSQNFDSNEFGIKQATGWDRDIYLNVWVAPTIGALGYAYVPSLSSLPNPVLDGIAIWTGTFGGPGYNSPPYNLGRTATHEVGHYLGLPHIWRNNGCGADDGFADTPLQDDSNFGCPTHPSPSCGNSGDMFMNYMDYVDDDCMVAFSEDQGDYMNQILNTSRSSLLLAANFACGISVDPIELTLVSSGDLECAGDEDGFIEVLAEGGSGTYTYYIDYDNLSNTTGYFDDLPGGTYIITVYDSFDNEESITVSINEPAEILINPVVSQDIECYNDSNAVVTFVVTGGSNGSYSYSLDNGPLTTNPTFENLPAGDYNIAVYDFAGCSNDIDFELEQPDEILIDSMYIDPVSCYGLDDGAVTLFVSGGLGNLTVEFDTFEPVLSTLFDTLSAGTYQAILMDWNNCTDTNYIDIPQPDTMSAMVVMLSDPSCNDGNDGSISIDIEGGNGGESYYLDGILNANPDDSIFTGLSAGDYVLTALDSNGCSAEVLASLGEPIAVELIANTISSAACDGSLGSVALSLTNAEGSIQYTLNGETNGFGLFDELEPGDYIAQATDSNGCSDELIITIPFIADLEIFLDALDNVNCYGGNDGEIRVNSGGVEGITFTLNGESNLTGRFTGLEAGDYTITASNGGDCNAEYSFSISEPTEISFTVQSTNNPLCNGDANGNISVIATGGSSPYTYSIGTMENMDGEFTDLGPGMYVVKVNDANGCTQEVNAQLTNPQLLSGDASLEKEIDCFGETATVQLNASGGTGAIEFSLLGESSSDGLYDDVPAGTYTALITDENGCQETIAFEISEPAQIQLDVDESIDPLCAGENTGEISVIGSGGTGEYMYSLDGETNSTGQFSELDMGEYTIGVSDENGCNTTITVNLEDPQSLVSSTAMLIDVLCFGESNGSVDIDASGGTGSIEYSLDDESNNDGVFENLPAGEYTIIATDDNGCTSESTVEVLEPSALVLTIESTDISCFGASDGNADIDIQGGTAPYEWTLNDENDPVLDGLEAGDYTIKAIDENGCETEETFSIAEPAMIDTSAVTVDLSSDMTSADIEIIAFGGTGAFSYSLNGEGFQDSNLYEGVKETVLEITIMDENGCTQLFIVNVPIVSSDENLDFAAGLTLYPNPANESIFLAWNDETIRDITMSIYDSKGALISVIRNTSLERNAENRIDISHLKSGAYLLRIQSINLDYTTTFVKE